MGDLTVQVDDDLIEALRARAAGNGRSAEAEHRAILREALAPEANEVVGLLRQRRKSLAGRDFSDIDAIVRRQRDERSAQ